MGTIGRIRGESAAVIGGRSQDIGRVGPSRSEGHQATHTVTGSANATWLHIVLRCEVIEKCPGVGHDIGRRGEGEELLHQDLALLWIREDHMRIHRLVWSGPIKKIRKQNIITVGCEPLADLEHCGTNPDSIHEYNNSWPRPAAGRAIYIARAGPINRPNLDLVHEYLFSIGRGEILLYRDQAVITQRSGHGMLVVRLHGKACSSVRG